MTISSLANSMSNKTIIGFVGVGFVGNAVKTVFQEYFQIETFDILREKSTTQSIKELVDKCNFIFVALPTPMKEDGSCDLNIIVSVIEDINKHANGHIIILKSSVPPGTTQSFAGQYKNINFVFNPEFLTERNALNDFKNQDKIILGGKRKHTKQVKGIYKVAFPNILIQETNLTTSEMTKFFVNCFLSTKVSFCNEMYQICEKLDIEYDDVIDLALLDKRVGSSHTEVPGHDQHMGFGGSCFPANSNILISKAKELGVDPKVLIASWEKNLEVRPEKDWEKLVGRAFSNKK